MLRGSMQQWVRNSCLLAGLCLARPVGFAATPVNDVAAGERALMLGRADEAIAQLRAAIATNPGNGAAHLLLCRTFYAEELADQAIPECEAALTTMGRDSRAQDWMGRAYGLKADRSGPLTGYKMAAKVRTAFEAAVNLDAKNGAAVNDLSEYYVGAPALLGGGMDKATQLADRVQAQLPQQAHRIRGLAAEKSRDFDAAEREFQAAVAVAGRPDAWTDLGHFYSRREEKDKALDALRHAVIADRTRDASLVDVASILIEKDLDPKLAEQALRSYLASSAQSDAAPVFQAHVLLGKLLAKAGDKAGAGTEYAKALALAHDYAPAQKAAARL
jgi:tetratricopeptide (TPR) repeat protein